jgi:hypothetical protein
MSGRLETKLGTPLQHSVRERVDVLETAAEMVVDGS